MRRNSVADHPVTDGLSWYADRATDPNDGQLSDLHETVYRPPRNRELLRRLGDSPEQRLPRHTFSRDCFLATNVAMLGYLLIGLEAAELA